MEIMNAQAFTERLFSSMVSGDRNEARRLVQEARGEGMAAEMMTHEVFWPIVEMITNLYRQDQLTALSHHYATRLMRMLLDQAQSEYIQGDRNGRRICLFSGPGEADELAGQLVADMAEAAGYEVFFAGGGIANDEILEEVGSRTPDILLMFASSAGDAPNIRVLIDTIREIDSHPDLQIVVGGGVFNRAPGLAEEIGADLWAKNPLELLQQLTTNPERRATPEQRTVGRSVEKRENRRVA